MKIQEKFIAESLTNFWTWTVINAKSRFLFFKQYGNIEVFIMLILFEMHVVLQKNIGKATERFWESIRSSLVTPFTVSHSFPTFEIRHCSALQPFLEPTLIFWEYVFKMRT